MLDNWEFNFPDLPKGSIKARVAWVHGQNQPGIGYIETGIKFLDGPVEYTKILGNPMAIGSRIPFADPDKMPPIPD